MSEELINQTQFVSDAPVPEMTSAQAPEQTAIPPKKRFPVIGVLGGLVVLVVVAVMGIALSQRKVSQVVVTPAPSATPKAVETTQIESDIKPYIDQIDQLNPELNDHPFPPIDFTVRIQDPNQSR